MTHEQIEQHRKRFDEIYPEGNKYYRQTLFKGYLLCAENMEVDLGNPYPINGTWTDGYHEAFMDCCKKLESQGIKVKT